MIHLALSNVAEVNLYFRHYKCCINYCKIHRFKYSKRRGDGRSFLSQKPKRGEGRVYFGADPCT